MVPLLLLLLLWRGSPQEAPGYNLILEKRVIVQEGLCVHVPCSFSYPLSVWASSELYIYWYRNMGSTRNNYIVATNDPHKTVRTEASGRFHLLEDPVTNSCSLNISDTRKSDTGIYYLRLERGYNVKYDFKHKMLNLQVTDLTEEPDIHVLEPLESGRPTRLTCSLPGFCKGGRLLNFSWAGVALDSLSPQALLSSVLTLTPRPRDHGTNLTCQVKRGYSVITERTIQLNVSYAPQNLTIHLFFRNVTAFIEILQTTSPLPILEGQSLRLCCAADSNPPAVLSWFRGSQALNATPTSSALILELPRVGTEEEGEFTCQAQHRLGSTNVSLSLSVVYPPRVSCSWEEEGLHCICSSRAQPAPSLRWRLGKRLLEENVSNASFKVTFSSTGPWANSSLSLREELSSSLRLSCEARNVHGAQSANVLLLPGKSVSLMGVIPGALGGAGAMALLSLCVCLICFCIVKARRKQAARGLKGIGDEDAVMGTVALGSKQKPLPERHQEQVTPAGDAPSSGEQQEELYYANLSFHGVKLREPQDREATSTTEYSEINTRK